MLTRALILLFGAALCGRAAVQAATPHEVISEHLAREVPRLKKIDPNDPYEYVAEANKYMMMYQDPLMNRKGLSYDAIKVFGELESLRNESCQCNSCAFRILSQNDEIAEQRTRNRPQLVGPLLPSEKALYQIGLEHAEKCRSVYPARLNQIIKTLDPNKLERLQTIINLYEFGDIRDESEQKRIQKFTDDLRRRLDDWQYFQQGTMARLDFTRKLLRAIKRWTENDRDKMFFDKVYDLKSKKRLVNEEKVFGLLDKHFYGLCNYYLDAVGNEVFEPLDYDLVVHKEPMIVYYLQLDTTEKEPREFYNAWVNYQFCQGISSMNKDVLRKPWLQEVKAVAE